MSSDAGQLPANLPPMAKLYVGRLPTRCTPRDLDELFAKYGKILHFDIKHGGYAFVEMENPQDAQDALNQLNGSFYEGQRIVVEWSKRIHRVDDICFKCNKPGHWVRDCPEARGSAFDVRSGKCFNCGEHGHLAKFCRDGGRNGSSQYGRSRRSPSPYRRRRSYSPGSPGDRRRYSRSPPYRNRSPPRRSPPRYSDRDEPPRRKYSPSPERRRYSPSPDRRRSDGDDRRY